MSRHLSLILAALLTAHTAAQEVSNVGILDTPVNPAAVRQASQFLATPAAGLNVAVKGGSLGLADGTTLTYTGGTVNVPANTTSWIMVDLQDLSLHALPRNLHRGGVFLARVTTSASAVTSVVMQPSFVLPRSRIERTKRKLASSANQPLKILALGDSLTEAAGESANTWPRMVFDAGYSSQGFNLPNLGRVTFDNFAVGGQTAHYLMAMLGNSYQGNTGQFDGTAFRWGPPSAVLFAPPRPYVLNPILAGNYDLAIINAGMNGGTEAWGYLENAVRTLRQAGVECIIHTGNNQTANLNRLGDEGLLYYSKLAETYGCELVDTWAYAREAQLAGQSTHIDGTHMNNLGHQLYARAMRSVLNDRVQVADSVPSAFGPRIIKAADGNKALRYPNATEVQFTPGSHTGTVKGSAVPFPTKNPALLFGRKTANTDDVVELTTGQLAYYGHPFAYGVDFLFDLSQGNFTADLKTQAGGTTVGSISYTGGAVTRIGLLEGLPIGTYGTITSMPGYNSRPIQLVVTSGTARVVGAVFHVLRPRDIDPVSVTRLGTWASEPLNAYNQTTAAPYTDTAGDSFYFEFEGTGAELLLGATNAGGQIDVYLDGQVVTSAFDLYAGGTFNRVLNVFADSARTDVGFGRHQVKVVLRSSLNASVQAPSAGKRRLHVLAVTAFDGR